MTRSERLGLSGPAGQCLGLEGPVCCRLDLDHQPLARHDPGWWSDVGCLFMGRWPLPAPHTIAPPPLPLTVGQLDMDPHVGGRLAPRHDAAQPQRPPGRTAGPHSLRRARVPHHTHAVLIVGPLIALRPRCCHHSHGRIPWPGHGCCRHCSRGSRIRCPVQPCCRPMWLGWRWRLGCCSRGARIVVLPCGGLDVGAVSSGGHRGQGR